MKSGASSAYDGPSSPQLATSNVAPIKRRKFWFFVLTLYLIFEYIRPQSLIPAFGYLRPGLLTTLALMIFIFANKKSVDWKSPQLKLSLYFLGLMIILIPFAHNNFKAYQATLGLFLMLPVMVTMFLLLDSKKRLRNLLHLQGFITVWLLLYGLLHHGRGPGNFLGDENDLALYATTWLPFFIYLYLSAENKKEKVISLIYSVSAIVIVIITFSRGGFVGLLGVGLVYWWYSRFKLRIILAGLVGAAIAFALIDPTYWQEMGTISDTDNGTADGRIQSWKAGWNMFLHNPFGVGPGNFNALFGLYQPDGLARNMWGRAAHSLWFTLIPEMGIIGIFLYLKLIFRCYSDCKWVQRNAITKSVVDTHEFELATACLASMMGCFLTSTFLSSLYYPHFWYLAILILCARKIYEQRSTFNENDEALLKNQHKLNLR